MVCFPKSTGAPEQTPALGQVIVNKQVPGGLAEKRGSDDTPALSQATVNKPLVGYPAKGAYAPDQAPPSAQGIVNKQLDGLVGEPVDEPTESDPGPIALRTVFPQIPIHDASLLSQVTANKQLDGLWQRSTCGPDHAPG